MLAVRAARGRSTRSSSAASRRNELASRIDDAQPKVVVSASCGIEPGRVVAYKPLLDAAIELAAAQAGALHRPPAPACRGGARCPGATSTGTTPWRGPSRVDCVPVDATDPLYILYTSGTTGQPKGIVRDNGGHAVALEWTMKHVYDVEPGEVYWAASDVGWVVGHSYIVYGPLLHGCTTVLYEGKPVGTPDAGAFWRVIAEHGVARLFTAPTAFRAIRQRGSRGRATSSATTCPTSARCFSPASAAIPRRSGGPEQKLGGAGDRPLVADRDRLADRRELPRASSSCRSKPGSPTRAVPGWDVRVLDDERQARSRRATSARWSSKLPLPPGALPTLWNADDALPGVVPARVPGLLQDRRRGLHRRGRLRVRHGADRRHHQRRGPPALDGRHGGGARRPIRTWPSAR